jgi:hypothetical protein
MLNNSGSITSVGGGSIGDPRHCSWPGRRKPVAAAQMNRAECDVYGVAIAPEAGNE